MKEVLEEKNVPTKSKKDAFMEYAGSKFEGFNPEDEEGMLFQFKHCTIIRVRPESECITIPKFQFKHCTIIRKRRAMKAAQMEYFNSSIVRL